MPESGIFGWVVRLTRGQLLDLVLQIESRLRQLIRTVLREKQSDWEKLVPSSIRSVIESSGPSGKPVGDLLDRANLGQLIGIVLAQWKLFGELLGDKPTFQVRANEFRKWRNSLAHGADPSADEKVEIAVLIKQVGQQIPVIPEPGTPTQPGKIAGATVVWVDDHPDWNLMERQILRSLSIDVIPVLSNDEAVGVVTGQPIALVISDIDHGTGEPGDRLPARLRAVGIDVPVVLYVGAVDRERGTPTGVASIQDDPALLVRDVLNLLSKNA